MNLNDQIKAEIEFQKDRKDVYDDFADALSEDVVGIVRNQMLTVEITEIMYRAYLGAFGTLNSMYSAHPRHVNTAMAHAVSVAFVAMNGGSVERFTGLGGEEVAYFRSGDYTPESPKVSGNIPNPAIGAPKPSSSSIPIARPIPIKEPPPLPEPIPEYTDMWGGPWPPRRWTARDYGWLLFVVLMIGILLWVTASLIAE